MKRMIIAALSVFFLTATAVPAISKGYNRNAQGRKDYKRRSDNRGGGDYKKRSDYHNHRGYREHPYESRRHYGHYNYKKHRYDYHGHWRSWEQWDSYARKRPNIYKHGTYYRENAHLMFRFCEPGTGSCFFFSIGR